MRFWLKVTCVSEKTKSLILNAISVVSDAKLTGLINGGVIGQCISASTQFAKV